MATRFYMYPTANVPPAPVSPAYDTNWTLTNNRAALVRKTLNALAVSNNPNASTTSGSTQNIALRQYVSEPLRAQTISGTFSMVVKCAETDALSNVFLAVSVNLVSQDGSILRGNLYNAFGTQDTEFPTTAATRIINAQAITSQTALDGDRITVEIGGRAVSPTASNTFSIILTTNQTTDYALTSGLTTTINSWCEFSQDLFPALSNNYQFGKDANGGDTGILSFTEKIR